MSTATITIPRTIEISKTTKSYLAIAGIVLIQLAVITALIPVGVSIWRSIVCPGC